MKTNAFRSKLRFQGFCYKKVLRVQSVSTKQRRLFPSKNLTESLIQWSAFSVCIALLPMVFSYCLILLTKQPPHPDFIRAVSSRGELLIVAAALLGEALSDMLKRTRAKNLNLFIGSLCLIPLMMSCLLFAAIQSASPSQYLDKEFILLLSNGLFVYSLLLGAACKFFGKT